jgi:deoxycytidylate deaminase
MALAFLSAQRSKDPNKQVGACIVDHKNIILGIGYNGFPRGCGDSQLPWAKKSVKGQLGTKYPYVVRFCCVTHIQWHIAGRARRRLLYIYMHFTSALLDCTHTASRPVPCAFAVLPSDCDECGMAVIPQQ